VEDEISLSLNFFNATMFVEEAKTIMEVNSFGEASNQVYQPLVPYLDFCEGLCLVGKEEYAKAYERILKSRSAILADSERQFSVIEGNHEFALGWISAERGLKVEAAMWFTRAMSKNHPYAGHRLYDLCVDHPECIAVLPYQTAKVLEECMNAPGFGIESAQQFVYRYQMAIAERRAEGLALDSRSIGQLPFFSGYESEVGSSQRLVREDPASIDARLQLCQNLERLPNYSWAAYELRDVLEMQPKSIEALVLMARIQYRLGNLQESKIYAQRWYQQLQETEPEEMEAIREQRLNARLQLADIYCRLGEYKSAIELLESDKFKIEEIEVARTLGILYLLNKDYDQALIHFKRCFNLVDDPSESFFRVGVALHRRGEFAGAVIAFEHSESLGLKNPAYQIVAKNLLEKCQKYKALLDSGVGAELPGKADYSAEDFIALAEAKKNLDSFGDAVQFYQKAFAMQPDLRTNLVALNRWNCIQAAIQAGLGEGWDFHRYTWEQRKAMRQFALELFAEEMNAIEAQKNVDMGYMYISLVRDRLKIAYESPEFSGVRDVLSLSPDLLEYEAIAWRQVWNSVERMLKEQAAMSEAMKSELEKANP
jgi:tetratricopeptide (TPR) repeat protein